MFDLRYMKRAEKFFKKIREKNLKESFCEALCNIKADPYVGERKVGDLAGLYCFSVYHNRTNYKIAYRIYKEDAKVVIIHVGTRENFYDELKNYVND